MSEDRTDTERLDFLQEKETTIYSVVKQVRTPRTDGGNEYNIEIKHLGWSVSFRDDEMPTIREAIDLAMDS